MEQTEKEGLYAFVLQWGETVRAARIAAKIFTEPKRSEEIIGILRHRYNEDHYHFKEGRSDRRFIANLLAEPMRSEALHRILEECKMDNDFEGACKVAEYIGVFPKEDFECFIGYFVKEGNLKGANTATWKAREGGVTIDEAREIFEIQVKNGRYGEAQATVEIMSYFSESEKSTAFDRILRFCIEKGDLEWAIRTAHSQYFQRDLTLDELKEILGAQMAKRYWWDEAKKTITMIVEAVGIDETSKSVLQKILKCEIELGRVKEAGETTELLGRKLFVSEIQAIVSSLLGRGLIWRAYEFAAYLPKEELSGFIQELLEKAVGRGDLNEARQIASTLSEPDRSRWLLAILEKQKPKYKRDPLSILLHETHDTVDMLIASL